MIISGEYIKLLRGLREPEEVAEDLGIRKEQYLHYEKPVISLSGSTVSLLAEYYGVTIEDIRTINLKVIDKQIIKRMKKERKKEGIL